MPTSAERNTSRKRRRAVAASGASSGSIRRPSSSEKSAAISPAVFSIAGRMMWTGCSPASWRMYSPRSDSTVRTPAASSASLSRISSLSIDFDFATSSAFARRQMSATVRRASSAVAAR
jgi:hypothetical protein